MGWTDGSTSALHTGLLVGCRISLGLYVCFTKTCSRRARGRAASGGLSRYPEIGYFGHEVFVQKYVFRLQVTMNHTALARVQKLHTLSDLWAWSGDNIEVE